MTTEVSPGEAELLMAGLNDDVAFVWVLIHLGLQGNPPIDLGPPSVATVAAAFDTLSRLTDAGLVRVGRTEYIDHGPPGRVAPVRHVAEPIGEVRQRVLAACASGADWEWSCWVVNTPEGDQLAHQVSN